MELTATDWFNRVKDEQIRKTLLEAYEKAKMDKEGRKYDSLSTAIQYGIDWKLSGNFGSIKDLYLEAEAGEIELIEEESSPKPLGPVPGKYYKFSDDGENWTEPMFYVGKDRDGKYVASDDHFFYRHQCFGLVQKTKITLKELIKKAGLNPDTTEVDLNS